jgi:propanediol dehydratase small subunit
MTSDPRRAQSGLDPARITVDNVLSGEVTPEDVTIRRANLIAQAEIARAEGQPSLARNFLRAAEMTAIPGPLLLDIYEKLRPNRSRRTDLLALSQELIARYDAPETGAYIREAAEVYAAKGLLKPD